MTDGSYSIFDHTADIGIEVRAGSFESVLRTGARALFEILSDLTGVGEVERRRISVKAPDREELLVRWLSELLFLHDTERVLLSRFDITRLETGRLEATVAGEIFDPSRHRIRTEIKAVTYHQVLVREEPNGWTARVVLDV